MKVRKAVIPAAGLGTRFLPATKAMPKEMLPIVDKPTIQFIVEEAMNSGIEDILIVTGKSKRSIEDHFDANIELEEYLEKTANNDKIIRVYKADTIEELAMLMDLDPEVVKAEVDRYNELARAGEDTDFGKAEEFLKEFKAEGPYYAALMYDATRGVYGGIKTSPRAEVVDKDGNPIPGLMHQE